jgi:5-(carboxyamino)imidazole ribonucleotide mutase
MKDNMKSNQALVTIVMGSKSDFAVMNEAAEQLNEFEIPFSIYIVSAHRTPEFMVEFSKSLDKKGTEVVIAGAGGSAHLPGMISSLTHLPVIGVPVKSSISLEGIDSLLSIVQMPAGIPVATVAINGAKNAGLLAARILALSRPELRKKIEDSRMASALKVKQMNDDISRYDFEYRVFD